MSTIYKISHTMTVRLVVCCLGGHFDGGAIFPAVIE